MFFLKLYKWILLICFLIIINNLTNECTNLKNYEYYYNNNLSSYIKFNDEMFFIVSPLSYYFSIKFNIIKVSFEIKFYDMKNKLIIPSKLALYNDLHILCYYKYENKAIINSFPYISQDKNFKCLEYYQLQELIKIGIKIYKKDNEIFRFYFFTHKSVNYKNNYYINDDKFNPLKINYVYINTKRNIINNQINNNSFISLKKLFFSSPNFLTKNKINLSKNVWHFKNIYNNYFCFCLGNNCKKKK